MKFDLLKLLMKNHSISSFARAAAISAPEITGTLAKELTE
jgi:hypothetical protein